jgi:hypothetical protein
MLARRNVLVAAITSCSALFTSSYTKATLVPQPVGIKSNPDTDATLAELRAQYEHMTRGFTAGYLCLIQSCGPLSNDGFIRQRQVLFRRIILLESGVSFSEDPNGMMSHPV